MKLEKIRTMEDFASVSGISRPTLSKYFNDPSSVRPRTRDRIEAALEQYEYTPNIYAINQNRQSTRNIGIVVPYLADPFFAEIARNLEPLCSAAGFRPILFSSHGETAHEIENLDSLRSIKPAGVLLGPLGRRSDHREVEAFCKDVPTVLFDCDIDGVGDVFVGSHKRQCTDLIVDYLCRTGEPPAFFEMVDAPNPNANKLRAAYDAQMRVLGHEPMVLSAEGAGWGFEEIGYREGMRFIESRALPTDTVLCSNDRLAIGFLAAAYEKGLRVGKGQGCAIRIAGHDDHPYSRFTCPSLTTVAQNFAAISKTAVREILAIIDSGVSGDGKITTLFDGKLVKRQSA